MHKRVHESRKPAPAWSSVKIKRRKPSAPVARDRAAMRKKESLEERSSAVGGGNVIQSGGQPLDRETRAYMEPRFGKDFSHIRVHRDAAAEHSARAVDANAFSVGPHLVFDSGRFDPSTTAGRRLLAHELAHTVQQERGVKGSDSRGRKRCRSRGDESRAAFHGSRRRGSTRDHK